VAQARTPHAVLLLGAEGSGKRCAAAWLARVHLGLAESGAADYPLQDVEHADMRWISPPEDKHVIGIEQIRDLVAEFGLTSYAGRGKVAVLDPANAMTVNAANALLKTLEEPGPATCLVLCADDAASLLPTVLSRAARLRLAPLSTEALTDLLVAAKVAPPAQARSLAIAAGGRPGLAITLAQQPEAVLARARIGRTLLELTTTDQRSRLDAAAGLFSDGALISAAARGEVASSAKRLQPVERRRAVQLVIEVWRDLGRDLAIAAHGYPRGIRDLDQLEELLAVAPRMDRRALRRFLDRLDRLMLAVEGYASPELTLDALLLSWPRPRTASRTAA
jgi:DNA polymerase-3 subunit delta'